MKKKEYKIIANFIRNDGKFDIPKIRGLAFTEMLMDDNERFLFQWWRVLKKDKLKLVLDHTLKKSKSGGHKKLRL